MPKQETEKKRIIKKSARQLFFRFGFNKTSMDDIAKQSGLAKPTLYYYYPNKESIFNEILMEEATALFHTILKKVPQEVPADEKIDIFLRTMYTELEKYSKELEDMPEMICKSSPHGQPVFEMIKEQISDNLEVFIRQGVVDDIFYAEQEQMVSISIAGMFQFMNLDWMRDTIVDISIRILLNGLKRRHS